MKKCSLCENLVPDYYSVCPSVTCKGRLLKYETSKKEEIVEEKDDSLVGLFDPIATEADIDDVGSY